MAIIKCEECGNEISDRAVYCPYCGFPRTAISSEAAPALITCRECGETFSERLNSCPKCGCPVEEDTSDIPKKNAFSSSSYLVQKTDSIKKKFLGLSKKIQIIIVAGGSAIVIAVICIIIASTSLSGNDKVAYELILDAAYNFKNPSSVRLVSGCVGEDNDCLFCGISATNGFGTRTTSYYLIVDGGEILSEKETPTSLYTTTKELNIDKINKKLQQKLGEY